MNIREISAVRLTPINVSVLFIFFADFSKSNLSDVELFLNYSQEQTSRLLLTGLPEALFFTPVLLRNNLIYMHHFKKR